MKQMAAVKPSEKRIGHRTRAALQGVMEILVVFTIGIMMSLFITVLEKESQLKLVRAGNGLGAVKKSKNLLSPTLSSLRGRRGRSRVRRFFHAFSVTAGGARTFLSEIPVRSNAAGAKRTTNSGRAGVRGLLRTGMSALRPLY